MKTILLLTGICSFLTQSGFAEESSWQIAPTFEDAYYFSNNGLAAVKHDGKWGYIDTDGKRKIKNEWDIAKPFTGSVALVKKSGKWGVINQDGILVVKPQYLAASPYSNGLAFVVDESNFGVIDLNGQWRVKLKNAVAGIDTTKDFKSYNGSFPFVNQDGFLVAEIRPPSYKDRYTIIMTEKGEPIQKGIPLRVDRASIPSKAGIAISIGNRCVIANSERILFDSQSEPIRSKFPKGKFWSAGFSDGVAAISLSGAGMNKIGYLSADGGMAFDFRKDVRSDSRVFNNGRGVCTKKRSTLRGFISKNGTVEIEPQWVRVTNFTDEGFAMVDHKGVVQVIDKKGEIVTKVTVIDAAKFKNPSLFGYNPKDQGNFFVIGKQLYNKDGKAVFLKHSHLDDRMPIQVGASDYYVATDFAKDSGGTWGLDCSIYNDGGLTKIGNSFRTSTPRCSANTTGEKAFANSFIKGHPYPKKGKDGFGFVKLPKFETK